jgi:hypothetical protein
MAYRVNLSVKSIQVQQQIYAHICESRHASVVVSLGVDVIHADRVRCQVLHQRSIALALGGIGERVGLGELIRDS